MAMKISDIEFAGSVYKRGGTSSQFLKADGSIDSSAYITRSSLSVIAPLTYNSSTGVFNINQASATTSGWLSFTDWVTFNSKQAAGNYVTTDTTQTISGAKTFTTQIWASNNIVIGGSNRQIQFEAAASSDLFISCIPGTRTLQIRNGNAGAPNYSACGLITGVGEFASDIYGGKDIVLGASSFNQAGYNTIALGGGNSGNQGRVLFKNNFCGELYDGEIKGDGNGLKYQTTYQHRFDAPNVANALIVDFDGTIRTHRLRNNAWFVQFQRNLSGAFTGSTWYELANSTQIPNGTYMIKAYVDTYAIGGGTYFCTYVSVPFWFYTSGTNNTGAMVLPQMIGSGHAGLNPPNIRIRLSAGADGKTYIDFDPNATWSNVQGVGGATVQFFVIRLGD